MRSKTLLMTTLRTLREVVAKEETGGGQRSLTLFDASCRLPLVLLLSYAAGNVLKKKHHHHHHHHHHSSSSLTTTKQHFVSRWCGRVQHLPQITSYMFVGMLSSASVREVSFDRVVVVVVVVVVLVVRFFFVCVRERDDDESVQFCKQPTTDEKRTSLFFLSTTKTKTCLQKK